MGGIVLYPKSWRLRFIIFGFFSGAANLVFTTVIWGLYMASYIPDNSTLEILLHFSVSTTLHLRLIYVIIIVPSDCTVLAMQVAIALMVCSMPMLVAVVLRRLFPDRSCRPGDTVRYPIIAYTVGADGLSASGIAGA